MFFISQRRRTACTFISLLFLWAPAIHSAEFPEPTGRLTLAQALAAAMSRNPDLSVASYELKASDARTQQAGMRLNPQLSAEFEDFAGQGDKQGIDSLQTTLSLSQEVELGAKRRQRVAVAQYDRELSGIGYQAKQLDVLAEVTRHFIDVVLAQEQAAQATNATQLAENTADAIAARVRAARTPEAELSRARIAVLKARLEQQQAASALASARYALAALWGGVEPVFDFAQADLYSLPTLASFDELRDRLSKNPDFVRFASEARLRDAELRLAQAQARPNMSFSVGVRRYEATKDVALVAGFSIGLPTSNRNQGAIAEATARRSQTAAEERATRLRIQATLFALYTQAQTAREQVLTLRNEALPQAQIALDQTQSGYERGRFSYLELASAQQDLLALRAAAASAGADLHRLVAEIERLTGEPLVVNN